jgi:hypothetical protein
VVRRRAQIPVTSISLPSSSRAEQPGSRLLDQLRATATRAIDAHVNGGGWCRACGEKFPCALAARAEFILGWLK